MATEDGERTVGAGFDRIILEQDIAELLVRVLKYEDKPHHLYSWLGVMGERYLNSPYDRLEARRIMDVEYMRDRYPVVPAAPATLVPQVQQALTRAERNSMIAMAGGTVAGGLLSWMAYALSGSGFLAGTTLCIIMYTVGSLIADRLGRSASRKDTQRHDVI